MRSVFLNIFSFILILLNVSVAAQYTVPAKPAVLYPVYDEANILSQQEKDLLNQKLIKFSDSTSTEIEVIIIPSTKGEDVNFLATEFGEKWGIGQKKVDNGVVFLIATEDHRMSIQQGRAVEQYLTAAQAGQILDYLVTPSFKQGKWYQGIDRGTSAIMDAVRGKFKPLAPKQQETDDSGLPLRAFIVIAIIALMFFLMTRHHNDDDDDDDQNISRRGRSGFPGWIFFPGFGGGFGGGSFGGGSFGGGGGGGFGGFGGGGSFGGGGASGGW